LTRAKKYDKINNGEPCAKFIKARKKQDSAARFGYTTVV
jgi:hypothetical protein